jgi:hypothetical protein
MLEVGTINTGPLIKTQRDKRNNQLLSEFEQIIAGALLKIP